MTRFSLSGLVVFGLLVSACGASGPGAANGPSEMPPPSTAAPAPSTSPQTACQGIGRFEALPVGAACWIEIATHEGTPLRVRYTIPASGWSAFVGTFKDVGDVGGAQDAERVGVLIADIKNLTINPCDNQFPVTPVIGPAVEDLAVALTQLPPFEVSSPPADVTAYGYSGTRLQIRVPGDQAFNEEYRTFIGCTDGVLASWISPPLNPAFYGYAAPGDTEDFWILDVEGTRVVIAALATANASDELIAEQQAILDSIVIEP